ncbi:MAG: flagellar basal-body MS-ring/collar protein FliF [Candidatus Scalinduaceae bacterium]
MSQIIEQIGNIWQGSNSAQKLMFVVLALGLALGLLGITYWVQKPEYALLYSDLNQKEAADIVANLRDNKVPYELRDKGSTIMVPSNKVYELRMTLAKNGLPGGSVGFEIFDKVKFGMSDLAQKVNYRRALQGELSKTISSLQGVEMASVQIVIPEPSLFIEDKKPSTASVILKTRNGYNLKPLQIAGITHFVSASVEGLSPENVTIADNKGNLLTRAGDSALSGTITNQLDLKKQIEDYYASKALSIVEKITGSGKAIVKASVDLDFKHIDEKQIEYDHENKVPISQTITTQSTEMPQMLEAEEGKSQLESSKEKEETETTQYAISKIERAVSEHVASVKRLTVAVLIDGRYEEEKMEDGTINKKFIERPKEELDQIAAIIKQAIGLNESPPRNDKFEIQSIRFRGREPVFIDEESIEKENKREFMLAIVKNGSLAVAIIAFLIFVLKALKRMSNSQLGYATYAPNELQDDYSESDDLAMKERRSKEDKKRLSLRDNIINNTKEDPKTTGNLIRKWMREGD